MIKKLGVLYPDAGIGGIAQTGLKNISTVIFGEMYWVKTSLNTSTRMTQTGQMETDLILLRRILDFNTRRIFKLRFDEQNYGTMKGVTQQVMPYIL
jgi:hypothetical protein